MPSENPVICIVGLGYVGLPLAYAFANAGLETHGFDINKDRIQELKDKKDRTGELDEEELKNTKVEFSDNPSVIGKAKVIIIAVPTPIGSNKRPDLSALQSASATVAENMNDGSVIVFESTVYPGVTEEICGKIIREKSGGKNFSLGYSPERVNPGDKEHTIDKIVKVVGGENEDTTNFLVGLYGKIIKAGIHKAPSIKVAEMAKAIENAQRDLNIAYVNEIAMLCNKLGISTKAVLEAAKTKWNFLPFSPGLVGGHCIGVDPYYLVEKAKSLGMSPQVITAGRSTNDSVAGYVAAQVLDTLGMPHDAKNVLVLGLTFKENVPDDRNSKSMEIVETLQKAGCNVTTHDPYISTEKYEGSYDAILLLVPHKEYIKMSPYEFSKIANDQCIFFDLKSIYRKEDIEGAGMVYLSL